jgi:hypothetical protein
MARRKCVHLTCSGRFLAPKPICQQAHVSWACLTTRFPHKVTCARCLAMIRQRTTKEI